MEKPVALRHQQGTFFGTFREKEGLLHQLLPISTDALKHLLH